MASTNLPTVPTPINTSALSHYLYGYNEQAASFLLEGFSHGFPLRYDGPQHLRFSQNHKSALQSHEIVTLKLHKEVGLGRVVGPFDAPPFANFLASPLGLVAKHEPGKFRLIHDLSFPRDDSINTYTSKESTTVHYETLDSVVDLVKLYGPGSLIAKADIQDALRIIPIRPQDYPFLGIMWDGKFYYDKVLPMGASVSCQLFETFSGAVQWMLHEHFGIVGVAHLLDDYIFVGPPRNSVCMDSLLSFELLSQHLGIPLNNDKRCLPSTCRIVYGIEVDTDKMKLRLPVDKLAKATSLVDSMVKRRKVTLQELQSLIGLLSFSCTVVPCGR